MEVLPDEQGGKTIWYVCVYTIKNILNKIKIISIEFKISIAQNILHFP